MLIEVHFDEPANAVARYHIDHRIGSSTQGQIYDDYPSDGRMIEAETAEAIKHHIATVWKMHV
jgi:hypothetical protein